ncbi:MAG: hypothetical protein AAF672_10740 [Pseudomonadota bacterium]
MHLCNQRETTPKEAEHQKDEFDMGRLIKLLVFLIIEGSFAIIGSAYLADLSPNRNEVNQPVEHNET